MLNPVDYVVIALVVAVVALAVRSIVRNRGRWCGVGCTGCAGCSARAEGTCLFTKGNKPAR